ncbi:arginine deiminase [Clostridium sp. HBUAS56010]|uniref:arginine deiminase n=1 Tax=Clostridium sp. HBUAS56010 TaxID=2571127 RepID=UPI001177BBF5|nr:arginine deiminase [Clostridium sp. HBUAS56010]
MQGIHVKSEIGRLRKVLLHRPGRELLNLTPDTLERLLFDDIPFLEAAQKEHDAFAKALKDHGVEVFYLEDMVAQVLDLSHDIKEKFIRQWIEEAGICTDLYKKKIYDYMMQYQGNTKELVLKTMEGIVLKELDYNKNDSLVDLMSDPSKLVVDPMPNLYFTRDPFACIGEGVSLNHMYSVTRNRETIYGEYLFKYHPDFKGNVDQYYDRYHAFHIEGGDILNISDKVLAVGISQRTEPDALELLAKNIFSNKNSTITTILGFDIPNSRAFMHLDTVFTQIDYDKFTVHPGILGPLRVYKIVKGQGDREIRVEVLYSDLETILEESLGLNRVELIKCGGEDMIAAEREQWNDGSNTLCIAPGSIITYERNTKTNQLLKDKGLHVIEIPSAELSRGRGGPRCMSMPLERENL